MEIIRDTRDTQRGPADWFSGTVHIDAIADPGGTARVSAANVHFAPGARTAWHTHPRGQTIWVTEGVGYAQRRGGPIEIIRAGDRVFFDGGEEHWHGASATRLLVHVAMQEADDSGSAASWGTHVSDEEYAQAPAIG
jgi:quercetin dioxygenase-like cupin family protein